MCIKAKEDRASTVEFGFPDNKKLFKIFKQGSI